jgi:hypothetical protein
VLWLVDDTPIFEFIVHRSFAAAFWEWLIASPEEHGVLISNEGNSQVNEAEAPT